jgi:hypothetical protein
MLNLYTKGTSITVCSTVLVGLKERRTLITIARKTRTPNGIFGLT